MADLVNRLRATNDSLCSEAADLLEWLENKLHDERELAKNIVGQLEHENRELKLALQEYRGAFNE